MASLTKSVVRTLLDFAAAHEAKLNDPHGDGTGDDAVAPTGDDYNELRDAIETLRLVFVYENGGR